MSDDTDIEATLTSAFESNHSARAEQATEAAQKATAFLKEYELDVDPATLVDAVAEAPYDSFEHRFDFVVGDMAADEEDCTDSREYRLSGFGDLAADPQQGA